VRCLPTKIPAKLVQDVTELDIDEHVQVKDLQVPEGVEVALPQNQTVAAVITEKHRGTEGDEEAAPAEGAAAATPDKKAEGEAEKK
jgi:large subunit ribosomal protein L25